MDRIHLPLFAALLASISCHKAPWSPKPSLPGEHCAPDSHVSELLTVGWSATERASLESRMKRGGLVFVRVENCNSIQVMRECMLQGEYVYNAVTRQDEGETARNVKELSARFPLGVAKLETRLKREGAISAKMAVVGMLEIGDKGAQGHGSDCTEATHLVIGAQIGAFEVYSAAAGLIDASASVYGVGAGGKSGSEHGQWSNNGLLKHCEGATSTDTAPPEGCGAIVRLELRGIGWSSY